jgi:hypothetical protein
MSEYLVRWNKGACECSIQPRSGDVALDPGVSPGQSGKYARAAERRSWFRNSLFSVVKNAPPCRRL